MTNHPYDPVISWIAQSHVLLLEWIFMLADSLFRLYLADLIQD